MRRLRGLSLIELLMAMLILAIMIPALTMAVSSAVRYENRMDEAYQVSSEKVAFEDRLKAIIEKAYIKGTPGDTTTYFVFSSASNTNDETADTLTFTSIGNTPAKPMMASEDSFESLNAVYGPQGGIREVSLSMVPVGNAGDNEGLFIREQVPADTDITQGGIEQVLNANIASVRFEAWDGTQWMTSWDTTTMATPRLPSAVSVYYRFIGEDQERLLVIRLPHSDVTTANPVDYSIGGTTP